jgi:hypothetical protein
MEIKRMISEATGSAAVGASLPYIAGWVGYATLVTPAGAAIMSTVAYLVERIANWILRDGIELPKKIHAIDPTKAPEVWNGKQNLLNRVAHLSSHFAETWAARFIAQTAGYAARFSSVFVFSYVGSRIGASLGQWTWENLPSM